MKRVRFIPIIIVLAVLIAVLPLSILGLRTLWNVDTDSLDRMDTLYTTELIFANAPEGTAYIDPLIKLAADDEHYVEFTAAPLKAVPVSTAEYDMSDCGWEYLGVDENSEITRLCEDGFVSLSLHFAPNCGDVIFNMEGRTHLELREQAESIFDEYGGFRAAYVDENGNVLGITEPAVRVYDNIYPAALIADGNTLTFRVHGIPKWQSAILTVITILEFAAIAALLITVLAAVMQKLYGER